MAKKVYVTLRDEGTIFFDSSKNQTVTGTVPVEVEKTAKISGALQKGILKEVDEKTAKASIAKATKNAAAVSSIKKKESAKVNALEKQNAVLAEAKEQADIKLAEANDKLAEYEGTDVEALKKELEETKNSLESTQADLAEALKALEDGKKN